VRLLLLLACGLVALVGTAVAQQATRNQATAAGSAGVAARLQSLGYKDIHDLRRGPNGQWTGKVERNGVPSTVTMQPQGSVIAR
jgi:hypothetical protein